MRLNPWRFAGAPLLVAISLYSLYSHTLERQHRREVLAHGTEAVAGVVRSSGVEQVALVWTDASGARMSGEAWTGKPFARLARPGQSVAIKYAAGTGLDPVVLSEAAERDRVNEWWIRSDTMMAIGITAVCLVFVIVVLVTRRRST